ncbi:sensor histidine kinase [Flexithrix dorotheae]|uniref:sensor histidine kinase n=1 Tax=Flexithrix dorotheae TaxID=70993 RepID=UPI0003604E92|nr:sensor histidine kinase [Flexithrix dorotheae]
MATKTLIIVSWFFCSLNLYGQKILTFDQNREMVSDISPFLLVFEDINESFVSLEIISDTFQQNFKPYTDFKKSIDPNSCYWIKLVCQNKSNHSQEFLITVNKNSFVTLYQQKPNDNYSIKYAGEFVKESLKEAKGLRKDCIFKILIEPKQTNSLFFKIKSITGFKPNILPKLVQEKSWRDRTNLIFIKQSFFHGVLWIIFLLSFLIFLVTKDKTYLFYALYVVSGSLYYLWSFGLTQLLIFPDYPYINSYLWSVLLLGTCFYFLFFRAFLETNLSIPFWDKILKGSILLSLLTFIVVIILQKLLSQAYYPITIANIVVSCQLILGFSMLAVVPKQVKTLRFALAGNVALALGSIASIILHFLSLEEYANLAQIGVLIEMVVFSLGLGYKIKLNEEKKRKTQIALIHQLEKNKVLQKKTNEHLEETVRQRTEEIHNMNQNLEKIVSQRTAELDLFLYRTSHDLKGPLARIEGLIQLANMENNNSVRDYLAEFNNTIKEMGKTLEKLLAISTINNFNNIDRRFPIEELEKYILETFKDQTGIINFDYERGTTIFSNPVLIELILKSLVENAFVFRLNTPIIHITFQLKKPDQFIIKILDNGIGIEAKYFANIFDMFFIGSLKSEGNGLGLYIVNQAVKKLNGKVKVKSILEKGTTFIVILPIGN